MSDDLGELVSAGVAALVVSAVLAWPLLSLLRRMQSRQTISQYVPEHAQKQGTPTMGGLIILAGVVAGSLCAIGQGHWSRLELRVPLLLLAGFALIGFIDDYLMPRLKQGSRGLGWLPKLAMQVAVAVGAVYSGGFEYRTQLALSVFVVLFFANAYNFADGMDLLAGGIAVLLAVGFFLLGRDQGNSSATLIMLLLGVATAPFLVLNAPPAKVFMGDVGALPIGAVLGWAFLQVSELGNGITWSMRGALPMALLLVAELVPVPLQILSVKLRKGKRLFPRTPIHHAFQHAGWPEGRVVLMFHLVQAALVVAGLGAYFWNRPEGYR